MQVELRQRSEASRLMVWLSPLLALLLTFIFGTLLFAALGYDPLRALYAYFIKPLTEAWSLEEIVVKATPLALIGVGLALVFRANVRNIGAEGQYTVGAICGSVLPVMLPDLQGPLILPAMLACGVLGGMAWAAIPAFFRIRFGASEILTSLMLVYVAQLLLDWLVRGPWRDPDGYNFPESRLFAADAVIPALAGRMHFGTIFALIAVAALAILLGRTLKGFEFRVIGAAPRAGTFAGFSERRSILAVLAVSGGLAGLAGIAEVAGTIGQLHPSISPGYGFTAIIAAFLGRLNPLGVLCASLLLALTYIGGESAQVSLGVSDKITRVFQGAILIFVLACDVFIRYRLHIHPRRQPACPIHEPAQAKEVP
ncbi:MAG: ABC transporter permease [Alphaproteobacteria bacterium]|nr:ABC transporter permease [Alphaproteobacteria bacterium]